MAKQYHVKPSDLAVLLVNLHKAAQDPEIGHGDASKSLRDLTVAVNRTTRRLAIPQSVLESTLWACNMLNEKGKFWSLYIKDKQPFEEFLKSLDIDANGEEFDLFYNSIVPKKGKKKNGK